jgi:hypothetical protein
MKQKLLNKYTQTQTSESVGGFFHNHRDLTLNVVCAKFVFLEIFEKEDS